MKLHTAILIALTFFRSGSAQAQSQSAAVLAGAPASSLQDSQRLTIKIMRSGSQPSAEVQPNTSLGPYASILWSAQIAPSARRSGA
jgi:hypothetical protein